jgi:hypothetical protein
MIETNFDVPFVAAMALQEKQIQQNYRPIIAVHKWFARRPGTLFRSLLLSEFGHGTLRDIYFKVHRLQGRRVIDPFMGGGTPLCEANRLGCDVIGYDINPMAYWIVQQEIATLDLTAYRTAASQLTAQLEAQLGHFYRTRCVLCHAPDAAVKYFLWVKVQTCRTCGTDIGLFPGYLVAEDRRHPHNVFVCSVCGALTETHERKHPGSCQACHASLTPQSPARRNRCPCSTCGTSNSYPDPHAGPPRHRMFAIEYHCPRCRPQHRGRFFKSPDDADRAQYTDAAARWTTMAPRFVPDEAIPRGDETDRLHRWGYQYYREMFNARQLLGLELSCRAIAELSETSVQHALATNLSDLLRYQNMLCRYDTMALKSLDIFSVHGFPVGLIQCESNFLGIVQWRTGTNIGSGGWWNIIEKYTKAKAYCAHPFEIAYQDGKKIQVRVPGEWIGESKKGAHHFERRTVELHCASATQVRLAPASVDAVLTDPPYFGNVQYAELMDFCYVWLRRLVGQTTQAFHAASTRHADELTGNVTQERDLDHFTAGLAEVFCRMAYGLKPGAPFVFTYHHNALEAYYPLAVALLDAGLTCSASLPCPAEMGASIHINKTSSSIVDTIFVCRVTGTVPRRWLTATPEGIAALVHDDITHLQAGGVVPTQGDIRCVTFGHIIRLAVWSLRHTWRREVPVTEKLAKIAEYVQQNGGYPSVERHLSAALLQAPPRQHILAQEDEETYGASDNHVSF